MRETIKFLMKTAGITAVFLFTSPHSIGAPYNEIKSVGPGLDVYAQGHVVTQFRADGIYYADSNGAFHKIDGTYSGPATGDILYNNDPTGADLKTPQIQCSGNGAYGTPGAYGAACLNMLSNPNNETYGLQVRIKNMTPQNAPIPLDVVSGFFGVDNTAYTIGSWALNPLINDNPDGGGFGAGVVEVDANNINCDNADPEGNYWPGLPSSLIRKTRTDGSACPEHRGMMISGVAGHVGSAGILFANKPMANGANQWEDAIDIIGSTVVGSNEIYSETVAQNNIKWKGTHTRAIDDRDANNAYAFASLPKGPGGRILWECPDNAPASCTSAGMIGDWYSGIQISGGMSEFYGGDNFHQMGIGFGLSSASGIVAPQPDTASVILPAANGEYVIDFVDGKSVTGALSVKQGVVTLGTVLAIDSIPQAAVLAIPSPTEGMIVNNSDTHAPVIYESGHWYPIQLGTAIQ